MQQARLRFRPRRADGCDGWQLGALVDARDGKGCTPLFRAADEVTAAAAERPCHCRLRAPSSPPPIPPQQHDGPSPRALARPWHRSGYG